MGSVMHKSLAIEPSYGWAGALLAGMSYLKVSVLHIDPALWMLM